MNKVLVTNNSKVLDRFGSRLPVVYLEASYLDVMYAARDMIHQTYKLLTNPMSGSLKPNQTPYKSILLEKTEGIDAKSVRIIENSIKSSENFMKYKSLPKWPDRILNDFKTVDLSLIDYSITHIKYY